MVYGGTVTVTTAGTPVPLAPARTPACWILIEGLPTNLGIIYVIGSEVLDSAYNSNSTKTSAGGVDITSGGILRLGDSSAINYYDLNKIYVDAVNSGDGVKYLYGRR